MTVSSTKKSLRKYENIQNWLWSEPKKLQKKLCELLSTEVGKNEFREKRVWNGESFRKVTIKWNIFRITKILLADDSTHT